jgi:hypothetical protein
MPPVVTPYVPEQITVHLGPPSSNAANVTVDFSDYQEKFGLMGGREYYGSGYIPTTNENGEQIDPEHCVIYTVTSYPDYSSGKSHITRIAITDPAVELFGLTLNSSKNDIKVTLGSSSPRPNSSTVRRDPSSTILLSCL